MKVTPGFLDSTGCRLAIPLQLTRMKKPVTIELPPALVPAGAAAGESGGRCHVLPVVPAATVQLVLFVTSF